MPVPGRGRMGRYYRPQERDQRGHRIMSLGESLAPTGAPQATAQDNQNDEDADFWRFLGDVAPVAGGALGAIGGGIAGGIAGGPLGALGGAGAGASLGHGLGSMGGQLARSQADNLTSDRESALANHASEEQNKADRKAALVRALMSMR